MMLKDIFDINGLMIMNLKRDRDCAFMFFCLALSFF